MKKLTFLFPILLLAACSKPQQEAVVTTPVELGELSETVTATGTVESVTQVDVGTQVTGIIDKLYADYNTVVKKGQLIAEIEKTLLESDLRSAEANVQSAAASVESARLTFENNRKNYVRDKALHDQKLISDYEFETTETTYKVSEEAYKVAQAAYTKSQADKVRAAKNLNYAEIYSPIDGIIISREVEVGQTVVSSMNVANLYVIADLDNMQIIGNVDEADIGQVKVGQSVQFTVDAYPDDVFDGHVTQVRLNPTTESNVVTYEVVVAAPNPDHKLIPGLTANLTIYTLQEKDVLLLPEAAFTFEPHGDVVKAPEPDPGHRIVWVDSLGTLTPVDVTIGSSNGMKTVISSGLSKGQLVATGYEMKAVKEDDGSTTEQSPFAPTPPGKKKK